MRMGTVTAAFSLASNVVPARVSLNTEIWIRVSHKSHKVVLFKAVSSLLIPKNTGVVANPSALPHKAEGA